MKAGFVFHFPAAFYPVAQIHEVQAQLLGQGDLPEYVEGAVTAVGVIRVKEGVDSRKAIVEYIDHRDHDQGLAAMELEKPGIDVALQQKVGVLLRVVAIHTPFRVANLQVTLVQTEMLLVESQWMLGDRQIIVRSPSAALATVGRELVDRYAQRRAGFAGVAIWSVGKFPATPEASPHQLGINGLIDQVLWCHDLRPCPCVGQVAAFVWGGGIKL